jgi:hypothetical protein
MNCDYFQTILQDLGRDFPMDLRTRQEALAHAEQCERCAAHLKDECRLLAGLDALAERFAGIEASPHVEVTLLEAFRTQAANQHAATQVSARDSVPETLVVAARQPSLVGFWHGSWNGWTARIAAVCLFLAGLTVWFTWKPRISESGQNAARPQRDLMQNAHRMSPPEDLSSNAVASSKREQADLPRTKLALRSANTQDRRAEVTLNGVAQPSLKSAESEAYTELEQAESATEFLPMSYGDPVSSFEGGVQMVRVELPRTTLLSFGFPMSEERAPEPIKADVLVGEDGRARAIRFVH